MTRLQEYFNSEIKPSLKEQLGYNNIMQVPKVDKIVLNMGIGEAKDDAKILDKAQNELTLIAGQKAVKTKAKKAQPTKTATTTKNCAVFQRAVVEKVVA